MLSVPELQDQVLNFSPRRLRVYQVSLIATFVLVITGSLLLVIGLNTFITHQWIDSNLDGDALIGAVLMPAVMAFVFVATGAKQHFTAYKSIPHNAWMAGMRGFWRGLIAGFILVSFVHYLGQLLVARAIFGSLEYHTRPDVYCGTRPLLYGLAFALPVGLGSALYQGYMAINTHLIMGLVRKFYREG